jgi:hypothetical protein
MSLDYRVAFAQFMEFGKCLKASRWCRLFGRRKLMQGVFSAPAPEHERKLESLHGRRNFWPVGEQ